VGYDVALEHGAWMDDSPLVAAAEEDCVVAAGTCRKLMTVRFPGRQLADGVEAVPFDRPIMITAWSSIPAASFRMEPFFAGR